MRVFWWRDKPNFGDALTREIARMVTGQSVEWAPLNHAELVVTGSIATLIPEGWRGTVAGIGWARPEQPERLKDARVLALRGQLSERLYGHRVPALGDPGLLAPDLLPPVPQVHDLGIVAHYKDESLDGVEGFRINVRNDPLVVIRQIASCRRILSSSLHGIVIADAYGIERQWHWYDEVQGGGFKFADYATVVGKFGAGEWEKADRAKVRRAQRNLRAALAQVTASE